MIQVYTSNASEENIKELKRYLTKNSWTWGDNK